MLEINVEELQAKIDNGEDFILLDVRREDEYAFAHLDNSVHIPLHVLEANLDKINPDKEVVVYCHHGVRSLKAAEILAAGGFPRVSSLAGGIHRWSEQIDPSIPTY